MDVSNKLDKSWLPETPWWTYRARAYPGFNKILLHLSRRFSGHMHETDVSPLCSRYLGAFCTSLQHTNVTSRWCMWRLRVACWVSGQEKAVRCALKHVVMTERHTKKPKPRAKVARYPYPRRMILSYLIGRLLCIMKVLWWKMCSSRVIYLL
jgi:hypothetical protein